MTVAGPAHAGGPTGLAAEIEVRAGGFTLRTGCAVPPGTVLAVLGPNGAGKTTLLRALAGLVALDAGRVVVDGDVLDAGPGGRWVPPRRRRVGVVFQDLRLFPHLTAAQNVAFGLRAAGARPRDAAATARSWLARLGIDDLAGRRPPHLSGGQAQRVALARALAPGPRMLLLDEPLSALDAGTRAEVRGVLRDHLARFAGPCVLVTHDPLEALVLADRVLVLEHGRTVQQGRPADVARRPATPYVAGLMGLTLLRGRLRRPGTEVLLDDGGVLHVASAGGAGEGQPVLVAVPPSAVAVHSGRPGPGSARNVWPGVVEDLQLLTDRVRLTVSGRPGVLVDVTPAAVSDLHLGPGSPVWLTVKATEVNAYPAG